MSTPPFLARDAETTPGVASQSLVTTVLSSGRYVIASAGQSADFQRGVTVDVLAGDLGLIPETSYSAQGGVFLFSDVNGDGNPDLVALQSRGHPGGNGGIIILFRLFDVPVLFPCFGAVRRVGENGRASVTR